MDGQWTDKQDNVQCPEATRVGEKDLVLGGALGGELVREVQHVDRVLEGQG